ncbi:hypothetical protein [Curtobacterium sp. MCBA15_001]|uniref:hypothetical protein n=1 Tax=Curtobacterium sp. MCBA15_001 TaxID=1898731 RepID=UPI0008DDA118|nr:hypothetical protein [Curtobacterium sp. MCBA15_001]OIH96688.1 hypothetical protein BIU90_16470 [Curtobacterium sp. MCBA15_001]
MGFLDRLLGREDRSKQQAPAWGQPQAPQQPQGYQYGQQSYNAAPVAPVAAGGWVGPGSGAGAPGARSEDEQAVERYRYLLKTAPPERIEEVHAEAFERLTPEQRRMVYEEFARTAPEGEAPRGDDPRSLAQAATRSEIRQPGYMERSLGGMNGGGRGMGGGFGQRQGPSFGGMLGASILGSVAGYVIASSLMSAFQPDAGSFDGGTDASGDGGSGDAGDGGSGDTGAENASYDDGGGSDFGGGGGFDDFGGDMGGGFDI